MSKEFIFYGDDVRLEEFPAETQFILPNPPAPPVDNVEQTIAHALDHPLDAEPLEKRLKSTSRVLIAFDDPCVPVPLVRRDMRGRIIEELLRRLFALGIDRDRIRLICANGLHRKWTMKELALVLGKGVTREMGGRIGCHDGTDEGGLVLLGSTPAGHEVEINRAMVEADLTIYVNVNYTTMNGGWKSTLVGLGGWRSIRHHHTPRQFNVDHSLMNPGTNPMHRILREMGQLVRQKVDIFQVECVLNNAIWAPPVDRFLRPVHHPDRLKPPGLPTRALLALAAAGPRRLKRVVRDAIRANFQLCAVTAGDVESVHRRTLDILAKQQNVAVPEPVDILVLGMPNLSPYSARSIFNPILLRGMVLGYMLGAFHRVPLVKKGGIVVTCNPGLEKFHPRHHPSYIDFWHNDLDNYNDPHRCWDELSGSYASNPVYLQKYRDDYAYHGTHCLMNWMWSGMGMQHVSGVILAGARQPATARKIGFIPARNLSTALGMARERMGSGATVGYPLTPPMFCVDVGSGPG